MLKKKVFIRLALILALVLLLHPACVYASLPQENQTEVLSGTENTQGENKTSSPENSTVHAENSGTGQEKPTTPGGDSENGQEKPTAPAGDQKTQAGNPAESSGNSGAGDTDPNTAGTNPNDAGTDQNKTGTQQEEPVTNPNEPSVNSDQPSTDPAEPVEEPAEPAEPAAPALLTPEEGIYVIHTALDDGKVLDVKSASTANGANISIYSANGTDAQRFYLEPAGNGTYRFINVRSDKALDVAGGKSKAGTNVQQYAWNGTAAQRWILEDAGDGFAVIRSAIREGFCLDVSGAKTANFTNVQVYDANGTTAQKFRLELIKARGTETVPDFKNGTYVIRSALDRSMVLDIKGASTANGANLQIYKDNGTDAQRFLLSKDENGQYTFLCAHSGKAVDVKGAGKANGTNVQQYASNGTAAQKWIIEAAPYGAYFIKNAGSSLYLDVAGAKRSNGTNVQIYTGNGTAAQKFYIELTDSIRSVPDGLYTIASKADPGYVLDISGASVKNNANAQFYQANDSNAQKFRVSYAGNGYYTIISERSRKALDVSGAKDAEGTNIQQYTANGTAAQKWKLQDAGDGSFKIVSGIGKRVLAAAGETLQNGTNAELRTDTGETTMRFTLTPTVRSNESGGHIIEIDPGHQIKGNYSTEPNGPGSSVKKAKVATGAYGKWSKKNEYELTLAVSLKLRDILEERGYTVYMTRTTHNVNISNKERAEKAAKDGAEILVHIHANGSDASSVHGVSNYGPASNNPYLTSSVIKNSQRLGKLLSKYQAKATGQKNLGTDFVNNMTGVNWAKMPVTIVEMGYMTNRTEDLNMASDSYQKKIAEGIANGIDAYFEGEG